jgi:hypothetical protein
MTNMIHGANICNTVSAKVGQQPLLGRQIRRIATPRVEADSLSHLYHVGWPVYALSFLILERIADWVDNEINNSNKHSLRSNTKGYGGKTD